jgi:hypothetical protein
MNYQPSHDFAIDLPKGEEAERTVASLLYMKDGQLVEVKRDIYVSETNNVAIEYRNNGKTSGLSITKAYWWVIVLNGFRYNGEVIVWIKTERLREIVGEYARNNPRKIVTGGDKGKTKMVLLPVGELLSG